MCEVSSRNWIPRVAVGRTERRKAVYADVARKGSRERNLSTQVGRTSFLEKCPCLAMSTLSAPPSENHGHPNTAQEQPSGTITANKPSDRADIAIFQDHLADSAAVIERLLPFGVACVMRERTPLSGKVIERLPNLKLNASTGSGNALIDLAAAGDRGITMVHTGYRSDPTIECTWALILASTRHIEREGNSVRSGGWQQTVGTDLRGKRPWAF